MISVAGVGRRSHETKHRGALQRDARHDTILISKWMRSALSRADGVSNERIERQEKERIYLFFSRDARDFTHRLAESERRSMSSSANFTRSRPLNRTSNSWGNRGKSRPRFRGSTRINRSGTSGQRASRQRRTFWGKVSGAPPQLKNVDTAELWTGVELAHLRRPGQRAEGGR